MWDQNRHVLLPWLVQAPTYLVSEALLLESPTSQELKVLATHGDVVLGPVINLVAGTY